MQVTIHEAKTHLSRLIAQALEGDFTVIGSDKVFDLYRVKRVW